MRTTKILFAATTALMAVLSGCTETKINGSVFVVTQGADNKPLGAVSILLYESDAISNELQRAILEMKEKQSLALEKLNEELPAYEKLRGNYEKARSSFLGSFNKAKQEEANGSTLLWPIVKFSGDTLNMHRKPAAEKYLNIERLWQSAYFSEDSIITKLNSTLPEPISIGRTDATGSFSINTKGKKPLAIVAESRRSISPGIEERYFWMVGNLNDLSQPILLSNHNLASTKSQESLVSYSEIIEMNPEKPFAPEPIPQETTMIPN